MRAAREKIPGPGTKKSGPFMKKSGPFMKKSGPFMKKSGPFMKKSGSFMKKSGPQRIMPRLGMMSCNPFLNDWSLFPADHQPAGAKI